MIVVDGEVYDDEDERGITAFGLTGNGEQQRQVRPAVFARLDSRGIFGRRTTSRVIDAMPRELSRKGQRIDESILERRGYSVR
jgi:hypothetical protein